MIRKDMIKIYGTVFVIISFFMVCDNPCFAQTIKCVEKPSQNYTGISNDIRSYEIIYDPTNEKDYVAYSELIKEKIKQGLKNTYTNYDGEGDVHLLFVRQENEPIRHLKYNVLTCGPFELTPKYQIQPSLR